MSDTIIASLPSLPREELDALAVQARTDKRAGDVLVRTLIRYVKALARQYAPRGSFDDDYTSAGLAGLWRAVQDYDPDTGPFTTYAAWWIKSGVREERRRRPTVVLTRDDIRKGHRAQGNKSLDSPMDSGGSYTDALPDLDAVDPCEVLHESAEAARLHRILETFPPRTCYILKARMNGKHLQEVADELGLSKQRVQQIEAPALARLAELVLEAA